MEEVRIMSAKERQVEMIPIDQIVVVNPRNRDGKKFKDNVRSIRDLGLFKPIVVNKRNFKKIGMYELICGQGRMEAYMNLGKKAIEALVCDCDEDIAQLMTLGENITRTPPEAIEFANRLKQMSDEGLSHAELSTITGKSQHYVREYIILVEHGEERLLKGVESGVFPLSFATSVAHAEDRAVQHLLMDAFDNGIVNCNNLSRVRRIIEDRSDKGRALGEGRVPQGKYTVVKLKQDIRRMTEEKESFVHQATQKENRLFRLLVAFRDLRKDGKFRSLLKSEGLTEQPELKGNYQF